MFSYWIKKKKKAAMIVMKILTKDTVNPTPTRLANSQRGSMCARVCMHMLEHQWDTDPPVNAAYQSNAAFFFITVRL